VAVLLEFEIAEIKTGADGTLGQPPVTAEKLTLNQFVKVAELVLSVRVTFVVPVVVEVMVKVALPLASVV
jgi:hypothetical protein